MRVTGIAVLLAEFDCPKDYVHLLLQTSTVAIKYVVLRDMTPCGSCKNRSFGINYRLYDQS
jgi:hypothetical protein